MRASIRVLVAVVQSAASDLGGGAPGRRDRARGHCPGRGGGATAHRARARAAAGAAVTSTTLADSVYAAIPPGPIVGSSGSAEAVA